jgi:DNA repair and recombination protein RAD52
MLEVKKTSLLDQPLDMTQIKHRQGGGGRQLAYISGKFAMDQANRIFGYGQWGYKVVNRGQTVIDGSEGNKVTMYTADVELWVKGAEFAFPGAGVGIVTRPYTVDMHEKAYKEAETDAMKRALRHYGDQFGLCLYEPEDYVDAGNGEMIQVKNVPVQHKPQQQQTLRRSSTPAANNSPKFEPASKELLASARQMYTKLGREAPADLDKKSAHVVRELLEQMTGSYRDLLQKQKARPAQPTQASQPTSTENAPSVKELRLRCEKMQPPVVFEQLVERILKANIPDDNLIPENRGRLKQALDNIEENRLKKAVDLQKAS